MDNSTHTRLYIDFSCGCFCMRNWRWKTNMLQHPESIKIISRIFARQHCSRNEIHFNKGLIHQNGLNHKNWRKIPHLISLRNEFLGHKRGESFYFMFRHFYSNWNFASLSGHETYLKVSKHPKNIPILIFYKPSVFFQDLHLDK